MFTQDETFFSLRNVETHLQFLFQEFISSYQNMKHVKSYICLRESNLIINMDLSLALLISVTRLKLKM